MIAAPALEIAVLVLGMIILMFEAFITNIDKRVFGFAGIVCLIIVLAASFFLASRYRVPVPAAPLLVERRLQIEFRGREQC